jgi:hypothetical protein
MKTWRRQQRSRGSLMRYGLLVLALAVASAAAAAWWSGGSGVAAAGTPRLVVDRTEIDLGILRFQTPARAAFTISNGGGGVLTVAALKRAEVLRGC